MNQGIYLYCLTPAFSSREMSGKGLDGEHPVFVKMVDGVAALLSEVDLNDFSGAESEKKMADLKWVADRALRHEEIILAAMKNGPVLPVRFGTVFSSLEAVAESLLPRRDILEEFFQDTVGKKEWTMKGYANLPQLRQELTHSRLACERERLSGLPPGRRYFGEQKIKSTIDKELASRIGDLKNQLSLFARSAAVGFSECRLQSREITGRDKEMFFNGALLVPEESEEKLCRQTDMLNVRYAAQRVRIELSGPWPPYHFAPTL